MKKLFTATIIFIIPLFLVPMIAGAHTGVDESMPMMGSQEVENARVSQEEFSQMEDVMLKMMNGEELSESEAQEMYSFMQSHHQAGWPVMMGYGGMGMYDSFDRPHMYGNFGSAMSWLYPLMVLVWLAVGVLLLAVLVKRLSRKTYK